MLLAPVHHLTACACLFYLCVVQVVGPRNKAATARGSKEVAERTPISQLFGGALQSTIRIRTAGNQSKPSVTQQPMFAVHLEAHHSSLEEAFSALTRPEQISGGQHVRTRNQGRGADRERRRLLSTAELRQLTAALID